MKFIDIKIARYNDKKKSISVDVVIQQHSSKLLMTDILMSETYLSSEIR